VLITLIDNGANVNAMQQTHCQWTLIHILVEHENLRLVKLLFERGADVHAMNDQGKTPYQLSLQGQRGHREMVDHRLSPGVWHVKKKARRHPFLACLTDTSILAVGDIERSQLF
jgi:ankyrin repeat protein